MPKSITKTELAELISETTEKVCNANSNLLENQPDTTIQISVNIASYVTMLILDELDVLRLE